MKRRDFLSRLTLALSLPPSLYICSASAQILRRPTPTSAASLTLLNNHIVLLEKACEAIIPQTETPGARAADVHGFIELLFRDWMLEEEQLDFVKGLDTLQANLQSTSGKTLANLEDSDMSSLMELEARVLTQSEYSIYQSFFKQLRAFTIIGYYTSEMGQKEELQVQYGAGQNTDIGPAMAQTYSA